MPVLLGTLPHIKKNVFEDSRCHGVHQRKNNAPPAHDNSHSTRRTCLHRSLETRRPPHLHGPMEREHRSHSWYLPKFCWFSCLAKSPLYWQYGTGRFFLRARFGEQEELVVILVSEICRHSRHFSRRQYNGYPWWWLRYLSSFWCTLMSVPTLLPHVREGVLRCGLE